MPVYLYSKFLPVPIRLYNATIRVAHFSTRDFCGGKTAFLNNKSTMSNIKVYFDDTCKLRAFDPVKFKASTELNEDASGFLEKIQSFNGKVNSLSDVLEQNAARIDDEKLHAIGLRMACENETDNRKRKVRDEILYLDLLAILSNVTRVFLDI
jgi:hypothetical protein